MKNVIVLILVVLGFSSQGAFAFFGKNPLTANEYQSFSLKAFSSKKTEEKADHKDKKEIINYLEIETSIKNDKWDFFGFMDFGFPKEDAERLNYDDYKYRLRYDTFGNGNLYLVSQLQETGLDYTGDLFLGLGSSFYYPIMGDLEVNVLLYTGDRVTSNEEISIPLSFQMEWGDKIYSNEYIILSHNGWMEFDMYTKIKNLSTTENSIQVYEGLNLRHKSYAVEVGYKYWINENGVKDKDAGTLYIYLIKSF